MNYTPCNSIWDAVNATIGLRKHVSLKELQRQMNYISYKLILSRIYMQRNVYEVAQCLHQKKTITADRYTSIEAFPLIYAYLYQWKMANLGMFMYTDGNIQPVRLGPLSRDHVRQCTQSSKIYQSESLARSILLMIPTGVLHQYRLYILSVMPKQRQNMSVGTTIQKREKKKDFFQPGVLCRWTITGQRKQIRLFFFLSHLFLHHTPLLLYLLLPSGTPFLLPPPLLSVILADFWSLSLLLLVNKLQFLFFIINLFIHKFVNVSSICVIILCY